MARNQQFPSSEYKQFTSNVVHTLLHDLVRSCGAQIVHPAHEAQVPAHPQRDAHVEGRVVICVVGKDQGLQGVPEEPQKEEQETREDVPAIILLYLFVCHIRSKTPL